MPSGEKSNPSRELVIIMDDYLYLQQYAAKRGLIITIKYHKLSFEQSISGYFITHIDGEEVYPRLMGDTIKLAESKIDKIVRTPRRISLKRRAGWRMPPNTIKVCRPSPFGNPFVIGKDGDRAACMRLYREHMIGQNAAWKGKIRRELKGRNLACWCKYSESCHADLLLQIANNPSIRIAELSSNLES